MPKFVYCAVCGFRSPVVRKAVPSIGRIIDLIEPHECSVDPIPLDLEPLTVPIPSEALNKDDNKFVNKLNDLIRRPSGITSVVLQDRREEKAEVKSTVPDNIFKQIMNMKGDSEDEVS
jgi:hypothetical protein